MPVASVPDTTLAMEIWLPEFNCYAVWEMVVSILPLKQVLRAKNLWQEIFFMMRVKKDDEWREMVMTWGRMLNKQRGDVWIKKQDVSTKRGCVSSSEYSTWDECAPHPAPTNLNIYKIHN